MSKKHTSGKGKTTTATTNGAAAAAPAEEPEEVEETPTTTATATVEPTTEAPESEPKLNKDGSPRKARRRGPPASRVYEPIAWSEAVKETGSEDAARLKLLNTHTLNIGDNADSVEKYIKGYMQFAPHEGSGGYSSFVTVNDAFTNQDMILSFTPQGILRQIALLLHRAAQIMNEGGEGSAEIAAGLGGLNEYQKVAVEKAREHSQQAAIDAAIATLAKAMGGDVKAAAAKLAQFTSNATPEQLASANAAGTRAAAPASSLDAEDLGDEDDDFANNADKELAEAE
jgi:hypothetical protein